MSGNETEVVENQENVQTPEVEAAPTADASAAPAEGSDTPAFTPDYKVKVMDNEYEVDEWLRPTITDPERNKRVKELYEKAYGLDHYKTKHQQLEEKFGTVNEKATKYDRAYETLHKAIQEEDFDTVNHILGVDDTKFWNYVKKKVEYYQKPVEEREMLEARRRDQLAAQQAQAETQSMKTQFQQYLWQMKQAEINTALSRKDVQDLANEIDARLGQKGAFLDRVVEEGRAEFRRTGKDITADEAVSRVLKWIGHQPKPAQTSQSDGVVAPVAQKNLKVIPNVAGTGNSPVKKKITSIEDLKKLAAQQGS